MDTLAPWLGATLTLCILSFLYRDNPLYKLAEHVRGYQRRLLRRPEYQETIRPNLWNRWSMTPAIGGSACSVLSVLMFSRFIFPRIGWLSRWPIAFVAGMYPAST